MSRKPILLINPYIEDFAAYDHFSRPLGLFWLSAVLSDHFDIAFINALQRNHPGLPAPKLKSDGSGPFPHRKIQTPDCLRDIPRDYKRFGIPEELFLRDLDALGFEPEWIFVTSGMTYWIGGLETTVRMLRERFPKARMIVGGIAASLIPDWVRAVPGVDAVVSGQERYRVLSELSALLDVELNGTDRAPDYDVMGDYAYAPVLTALGCVMNCAYCASRRLSGFHELPLGPQIDAVKRLYFERGVRHFAFYDDALLYRSHERLVPFLQALLEAGVEAEFHTPNGMHLRFLDAETALWMKRANFTDVRMSLESSDEDFQKTQGGKASNDEFKYAMEILFHAGFQGSQIRIYTLLNVPGQKPESVERTMRLIASCGVSPMLAFYSPIPGTPDFERSMRITDVSNPLFQNNTVYLYRSGFSPDYLQELKTLEKKLRQEVEIPEQVGCR